MEGDMLKVVITVIALLVVLYYLSSGILSLFGKGASHHQNMRIVCLIY